MKDLYPLFGIVAIPQTPFDDDDRVDFASLERAIDDRIAAGVSAILVPVVASEVSRLTLQERRAIVRSVLGQVADKVPVIIGASSDDPASARAMSEFASSLGAAGVLVQVPLERLGDRSAIVDFFDKVCEASPRMLMIQDLDWGGPGLPVDQIAELFEVVEPFRCIKVETVPAGSKYSAILQATNGRLNVSGGWAATQLIEALDRGVHAFMPGGLHWIMVEIVRRYTRGDREAASDLFNRLLPILAWQNQHIDVSNQFLKLLAVRQGIFSTSRLRSPMVTFDDHHQRIADELVEAAVALHAEVGWRPPT